MKFADIPAHDTVKERLRHMVLTDRLPHALLLEGPEGVGKFALARAFAQFIHCENRTPEGDSCGRCPSCRQHETFNQPDTFHSFPVLKTATAAGISDDLLPEWRKFLSEEPYMNFEVWQRMLNNPNGQPLIYSAEALNIIRKFSTTSYATRYKILLMWLPERMQPDCANKLLKMIEEPAPDSLLIFVSNQPEEILPTIYSRLQRVILTRIPDADIASHLMATHPSLSSADANVAAHLAEGSILAAERQLTAGKEAQKFLELFITLMRTAYQRKIGLLKGWSADVASLGREGEIRFLTYCERMMRENFISNIRVPSLVYLNAAEQQFSSKFSPFINERNVERLLAEFTQARVDIAANGNASIILFDLAVKVILLLKQ